MNGLGGFFNLVKFLWANSGTLLRMFQVLLQQAAAAGARMEQAGQGAINVSVLFKTDVKGAFGAARTALDTCHDAIHEAASEIDNVADAIGDIKVPALRWDWASIMGVNLLVTGLEVTQVKPFDSIETYFEHEAAKLRTVKTQLAAVMTQLQEVESAMLGAGNGLAALGTDLKVVGQVFKQAGGA